DGMVKVLVLGWGSTYGSIGVAVRQIHKVGGKIAQAHLRYLNPFPSNLDDILRKYDKILIPKMNLNQLAMLLRAKYLIDVISYTQVHNIPLGAAKLTKMIDNLIKKTKNIDDNAHHLKTTAATLKHNKTLTDSNDHLKKKTQ